jgi:metallo-beta-lactamase family protein
MALFNWVFAHSQGGEFVLRIEDTDVARSTAESEQLILDSLRWLGIGWDEGPDVGGPHGPYRQSARKHIYLEHARRLVEQGDAFHCFCTPERLEEMRNAQRAAGENPRYDGHCLELGENEVRMRLDAGEPHVIRMKVPSAGVCSFEDVLRGSIEIPWSQVDMQVLVKQDGFPTYHLAVVVDDHLMEISHILRGEEWISSAPKHKLLFEYFDWPMPTLCHLPLLRNPDQSKLSKRKNPTSVNYYRRLGILPEALVNYLGMMGWAMPDEREIFTPREMAADFELERIHLGPGLGAQPGESGAAGAAGAGAHRALLRPDPSGGLPARRPPAALGGGFSAQQARAGDGGANPRPRLPGARRHAPLGATGAVRHLPGAGQVDGSEDPRLPVSAVHRHLRAHRVATAVRLHGVPRRRPHAGAASRGPGRRRRLQEAGQALREAASGVRRQPDRASLRELEFYGAAGRVTGSCHVLRVDGHTVLLDCGLIQGGRDEEALNAAEFPFDPAEVDAVVLSHAHLDHAGRLPLLVRRGFRGTIHAQNATRALMRILLADAANLEAMDIRRQNRRRRDRGRALAQPLFDAEDVARGLLQTTGHHYGQAFEVAPGLTGRFHDAGHIMGSSVVEVGLEGGGGHTTVVFSGDLGQYDSPILNDPVTPRAADLVLMESTYGDRDHRDRAASIAELGEVLALARRRGGNVLIPAFAVGRSQELLYQLGKHYDQWDLGAWHIFLDSPLAIDASEIYWDFPHLFDEEASEIFRERDFMPSLPNLHFTRTAAESKVIDRMKRGAIVIAGSGMCNGGRILNHFKRDIGRPETQIVFTGYQPPGTLGRRLIEGVETVRIDGEHYPVHAGLHTIGGLSAHGGQRDLLRWYRGFGDTPAGGPPSVYLVHGDPDAAVALRAKLATELGAKAHVAVAGERVDLASLARR